MKIRKAMVKDFEALVAIGHKFFEFNPYRHYTTLDEESLIYTLSDLMQNHVLLVLTDDDRVVGTAGAFVAPLFWNHNFKQGLEAFWWVDEEYRGAGTGAKLRLVLQEAAKLRGANFWNMIALKDSMYEQVCSHYERAGFSPAETVYMKVL